MQNTLIKMRNEKKILIAAHRGYAAGNIPCNTKKAFDTALYQGADILETDITVSRDGTIFVFHPKREKSHLNLDIHLEEMESSEIRKLRYVNFDNIPTEYAIMTLDDFLETYKNRCVINLDHAWDNLTQVLEVVKMHNMEEQILIKTPAEMKFVEIVQSMAPKIMYMPILKEKDEFSHIIEKMNINFVGSELMFKTEDSPLVQDSYIEREHKKGRLLWVNSILCSHEFPMSGGHTDDVAVAGNPDYGWGWLIQKGFDIIQTDWVLPLRAYISQNI